MSINQEMSLGQVVSTLFVKPADQVLRCTGVPEKHLTGKSREQGLPVFTGAEFEFGKMGTFWRQMGVTTV